MAKLRTQGDQRRDLNPLDQFGRKWLMQIELITGDPTGAIHACFPDPLRTPMQYLRVPRNADNQSEIGRLIVDFGRWIRELEDAEEIWYKQLHQNALHVYKAVDPKDVAKLDQDKFLLDLTGPKPWPSSDVVKRAAAGDRELLGLEPLTQRGRELLRMPTLEDLKKGPVVEAPKAPTDDNTPPDTYQDFVSWAWRTGIVERGDFKKVAELWGEHKRALAVA